MSEPAPEAINNGAPAAGGFMSRKFLGIPAIFWLLGAAILAYLYFRNRSGAGSGATSSAGSGQSTTGNISIKPGTTNFNVKAQYGPNTSTATQSTGKAAPPKHRTHNPQPDPDRKPTKKKHQRMHPVHHGGEGPGPG